MRRSGPSSFSCGVGIGFSATKNAAKRWRILIDTKGLGGFLKDGAAAGIYSRLNRYSAAEKAALRC